MRGLNLTPVDGPAELILICLFPGLLAGLIAALAKLLGVLFP